MGGKAAYFYNNPFSKVFAKSQINILYYDSAVESTMNFVNSLNVSKTHAFTLRPHILLSTSLRLRKRRFALISHISIIKEFRI